MPLLARIGRGATVGVFVGIVVLGLLAVVFAPVLGGGFAFALALFGVMAALTAAAFLTIVWMTRLPESVERTIAQVSADERPSRCRVFSEGERWTLPVEAEKLRVGQKIRVRFREIAPLSDLEPGREVLEVRVMDE